MSEEELPEEEVEEELEDLEIWGVQFGRLATRVEFDDYSNAVEFANLVFEVSSGRGQKPEVEVSGDAVEIDVWTPDVGITGEDIELASDIEEALRDLDL
ncbi:MAG: 4a-hydroxytetrahydrobiopterin dehydratase [Candidatus Nanohaloarchaea archaeon]